MSVKVTFLGTGESMGIPRWSCECNHCELARRHGRPFVRTRTAILIQRGRHNYLIDTGPDIRAQLLEAEVMKVDGIFWTHIHYDHTMGFAEFYKAGEVHVYGLRDTVDWIIDVRKMGSVKAVRHYVNPYETLIVEDLSFQPFIVAHKYALTSVGWMVMSENKKMVVTGDAGINMPDRSLEVIKGAHVFVVNAGYGHSDPDHCMNLQEGVMLGRKLGAKRIIVTHFNHRCKPHDKLEEEASIWPQVKIAYDFMQISL